MKKNCRQTTVQGKISLCPSISDAYPKYIQISQIYPNIPSWRSWVGGKSLGQFQQKLDALAQDVLTDPGWNRWKMATVCPPHGPWFPIAPKTGNDLNGWFITYSTWFMKIRAREIPTCGENPDWLGFGWAKAAFNGFGNLWVFPTNYRSIGSVLHFSFQVTPLYPHGSSILLLVESSWIHQFGWLTSIEISSVTQEGPSSWMIGQINQQGLWDVLSTITFSQKLWRFEIRETKP